MMLRYLALAGGLLVFAALVARFRRFRSERITTEHLSGDWVAQARAKEDQQW